MTLPTVTRFVAPSLLSITMLVAGLFAGLVAGEAMAIEEPDYQLIDKQDDFELRSYSAMIIAETTASGDIDDASSNGFRAVADFIFGNNSNSSGASQEISMTAPVTISPGTPQSTLHSEASQKSRQSAWNIHFVMPSEYSMETLPNPNNEAVRLIEVAPQQMAVIRFSGLTGEGKVAEKTQLLLDWMASRNLTPVGEAKLARYNPPWTLPFWRRNEVMIEYRN